MAIKFKGVDLDGDLERVIPHVAAAEEYGGALQHLQSVWDNLTLLGELSGNNTDMSGTRVAFRELAETLLNQLGREALKKCPSGFERQGPSGDQHSGQKPFRAHGRYRLSRLR